MCKFWLVRDHLHLDNGSEEKRGLNPMEGSCKGEINGVNVKHILLAAQDIMVGTFVMARLNSRK